MGELSPWHWVIVLLIFALLFGGKRLPDAARGLGRSLRIFKSEMSAAVKDEPSPKATAEAAAQVPTREDQRPADQTAPGAAPPQVAAVAPVVSTVPPVIAPTVVTPQDQPVQPA
ncbi:MAG TPA: Sec-independent protein translocase subunit TatA [Pseudonocardiaceae bacterium]|jgi:sec-independent protein translocase protein TatA|nr:Sec-independent protein translocase subunit TatA [Pseudonocardiaceae bacterium]